MPPPPYRQPPHRPRPKLLKSPSRVSLARMVRSTAPEDRQKANTVRLSSVLAMAPPSNLPNLQVMRGRTMTTENTHEHTQRVFWSRAEALSPDSVILVDCTCPRYAYYYEWANAQQGAGFIYRSNGEPPTNTNPQHRRGCCKHLLRFLSYLLKQTRDANRAPARSTPVAPNRAAITSTRGTAAPAPAARPRGRTR